MRSTRLNLKVIIFLIGNLSCFQSLAQENSFTFEADTLVITKSDFLNNPFDLGNDLTSLLSRTSSRIDKTPIVNLHLESQIDTVYRVQIQQDFFQIYRSQTNDILFDAEIRSKNFPVYGTIKIGMKKSKLKRILKSNYEGDIPDYLKIRDFEYMSWIYLYFEKKKLSKIRYTASLD